MPNRYKDNGLKPIAPMHKNYRFDGNLVLIERLKKEGLLSLPFSKPIAGISKVRELRTSHQGLWYRVFYYMDKDNKIILLHGIKKEGNQIPKSDLKVVEKRLKDYQKNC